MGSPKTPSWMVDLDMLFGYRSRVSRINQTTKGEVWLVKWISPLRLLASHAEKLWPRQDFPDLLHSWHFNGWERP